MRLFRRQEPSAADAAAPVLLHGLITCKAWPLVYLNMPKSGCTTVKNILYYLEYGKFFPDPQAIHKSVSSGKVLVKHHKARLLRRRLSEPHTLFTLVRHPLKRAYSAFNDKVFFEHEYAFANVRRYLLDQDYGLRFPAPGEAYSAVEHGANFARFLAFVEDNLARRTTLRPNPHWQAQARILQHCRRHYEPDVIGKVERLADDMQAILDRAGVPCPRAVLEKRFNESPRLPFAYGEALNEEVLTRAERIYRADFQQFDYSPEAA